ncbi:MAG: DUF2953 domain-containing protein [Lachnospiraceae bacterium]|nr:DUF2953 domain-containing protein [Lachnospiraceae bacterium]
MGIVLGILGTLGKILLCLLGIFCVLVLLLLFYPIKYQVQGEWREGARVRGRLHWFWFLVRIYVSYEEDFQWKIRLLGFDLMKIMEGNPGGGRKKRRKKSDGKRGVGTNRRQEAENGEEEGCREDVQIDEEGEGCRESVRTDEERENCREGVQTDGMGEGHQEGVRIEGTMDEELGHTGPGGTDTSKELQRVQNTQNRRGEHPFKKWWHKFRHFVKCCKNFIENLRRKAGFARDMASLLREDNSRELVCILKDNVLHLWRKLKPKVFRGHLLFGTGDPASTGEILGLFAILYAWYGNGVRIVPDFERKIWEGELFARGGISIFTLLLVYFRVLRSDEWRCFKKEYDRLTAKI